MWNPQSQNGYAYVSNNPLMYTDPSGHKQQNDILYLSSDNFVKILFWTNSYENATTDGKRYFAHGQAEQVRDDNLMEMAATVESQIQHEMDEAWSVMDAAQNQLNYTQQYK